MTVQQVRRAFSELLRERLPTAGEIARAASRVLRRNVESRIYHWHSAIRADGSGDVTATHVRWKGDKNVGYVPSPLYAGGFLYVVADKGLMRCYEAASGKIVWEHDLKAPFYSSPVLAGGKLYA